jgi:Fungal chitosanase of glycosyl hydrolase group 75
MTTRRYRLYLRSRETLHSSFRTALSFVIFLCVSTYIFCISAFAQPENRSRCDFIKSVKSGSEPEVHFYSEPDGVVSFVADMDILLDGSAWAYNAQDPGYMVGSRGPFTKAAPETVCYGVEVIEALDGGRFKRIRDCRVVLDRFEWFRERSWPAFDDDGLKLRFYGIEAHKVSDSYGRTIGNKPCIHHSEGWMVSQTAGPYLSGAKGKCNPEKYIDALRINGIVVPKSVMSSLGGGIGDLAVVRFRGQLVGGLVSDVNDTKAGEATAALAAEIQGRDLPKSLLDTYRLGIAKHSVEYFVFPGSKRLIAPVMNSDNARIVETALGVASEKAIGRHSKRRACGYRRSHGLVDKSLEQPEDPTRVDYIPPPDEILERDPDPF